MVTQKVKCSVYSLGAQIAIPLLLSGCLAGQQQQFFSIQDEELLEGGGGGIRAVKTNQQFTTGVQGNKKIDFLFVVDNSGSMADNQAKLAAGFEAFANTFYRRADLDICTMIITTDRYLGKVGPNNYQKERTVACTKPTGSENWTQTQRDTYITNLIADFKTKVNVGVDGSGTELAGKSLVSFLYNLNSWNSTINTGVRTSFFRQDAVANISFMTDENNYYYNANIAEVSNDIPAVKDTLIPGGTNNAQDGRKGIKDYLDEFFTLNRPNQGLSYSVTGLLELTHSGDLAKNIQALSGLVSRESSNGDIAGTSSVYTGVYAAIADALVVRATAFNLNHNLYEPFFPTLRDLKVNLVAANGRVTTLSMGSDYTVAMPNGIALNATIAGSLQSGDKISVDYRYLSY